MAAPVPVLTPAGLEPAFDLVAYLPVLIYAGVVAVMALGTLSLVHLPFVKPHRPTAVKLMGIMFIGDEPVGEKRDVEPQLAGAFFRDGFRGSQEVEQQGGETLMVHLSGDHPVSRTQAAAAAAVGEDDQSGGSGRDGDVTEECDSSAWDTDFVFPQGGKL